MDENTVKALLKNIGVPLYVITFLFFIGVLSYLYYKFLETEYLSLQIRQLKMELDGNGGYNN
jgi:hypothetical protein